MTMICCNLQGGFERWRVTLAELRSDEKFVGIERLARVIFYFFRILSPSESQLAFLSDVQAAGGIAACADGLDRALAVLEGWQLLRGRVQ